MAISFIPQANVRLPIYDLIPNYSLQRSWSDNPEQTKPRKIIVNKTEFILNKTEIYMFLSEEKIKTYNWQELRRYLETDRGFFLDFTKWNQFNRSTDSFFIPKRIFTIQEQIDTFRELLSQCEQ